MGLCELLGDFARYVFVSRKPFVITPHISGVSREVVTPYGSRHARGYALFRWMQEHVTYNNQMGYGCQNSVELWHTRQGKCDEQAILYITMCRSVGIPARFYHITRDRYYEPVNHACAAFKNERRWVYVDPAYHTFDIAHSQGAYESDSKVYDDYCIYRKQQGLSP